ncbi:MAG: UDP-N-acetylmuramoyl-L-alanyl-D-glutamate--2,6-diaminopimelate ligase [Candidatus Omnitrophica bacterium]|nr:UDP-N-acetylmuramoyl-L-alanyl-D-glutamate--2,6-diaminopimelate ligase [Candidatus Omnitrophota bacterium]
MKIADMKIKGITSNSKEVKKDFLFVAIKGRNRDGNSFIGEALARGASIVAVQGKLPAIKLPPRVKLIGVKDSRDFFAHACAEFYRHPSRDIKVIGITGTNGKTTITYLIEAIAKKAKLSCGVIGTISHRFKGRVIKARNTTPGAKELQGYLSKMLSQGVKYCAMEVSSHALDQERTGKINFSHAIFTNLTQDHLDYHKNLEDYFQAKAKLFRFLPKDSAAIINNDDKYSRRLKKLTVARVITYGIKNRSTVMARDIKFSIAGSSFTLAAPKIKAKIRTVLVGKHNIYNLLAGIAWGISEGLDLKDIKSGVEQFKTAPGRLEKVACNKGYDIFVDYAHTPDALFNVITALRPLVRGRIIVVFGCGGERDKLKRPKMGRIVTQLADYAIITNDNPRSENPLRIIRDIRKGIRKNNFLVMPDRLKAIEAALSMARKGDCLIIAGKGHEDNHSDRKAVQRCLKSMK